MDKQIAASDAIPVIVVVGPTAAGKTDLLLGLSGPHGPGCIPPLEVVSADSMQAYRGMDIGTAKPGADELAILPHRLIDIRDPDEQYTVGDFVHLADEACLAITASGHLPVISGGTGFYVRNFIFGLPSAPAALPAIREAVARDLEERGADSLRAELAAGDPESAARIHVNDLYRLTRALEILRGTGKPLSGFAVPTEARAAYRFLLVELSRPREELCERIDRRVDAMFARGLPSEVDRLRNLGYGPGDPGMKAIGYREFFDLPNHGPAAIAEAIKLDTRRYAKRQETFFRGLPGLLRLESGGDGGLGPSRERLAGLVEGFIAGRAMDA